MRQHAALAPFPPLLLLLLLLLVSSSGAVQQQQQQQQKFLICSQANGIRFPPVPPSPSHALSFCHDYSRASCCNTTTDQQMLRRAAPYYVKDPEFRFSSACVAMARAVICSTCDPLLGTETITSLCENFCQDWFLACRKDFFVYDEISRLLSPCVPSSMLCSPLENILSNGLDFCALSGYKAVSVAEEETLRDNVDSSRSSELVRSHRRALHRQCFDGTVSVVPTPPRPTPSWLEQSFFGFVNLKLVAAFVLTLLVSISAVIYYEFGQENRAGDVASSSDDAIAARRLLLTEKWAARNPEDARRIQEQMERRQTSQVDELSQDTSLASETQHSGIRTNSGTIDTSLASSDNEAAI